MNTARKQGQFGLWESRISPTSQARSLTLVDALWDHSGWIAWLEMRSDRGVLVVQPPDGQAARDLNDEFSIRAHVGYGGGEFTVSNGAVYFIDAKSGGIYSQSLFSGKARPLIPAFGQCCSPTASPDGKWLLFIRSYEGDDFIEIIDTEAKWWPQKLVWGEDFYMQPCWHPNGKQVAWIAWNHPNMPWDGTKLYTGNLHLDNNNLPTLAGKFAIAGDQNTSVMQPEFSPNGKYLAYVSDQSGYWQIYLYDLLKQEHRQLTSCFAEHAAPAWIYGMRNFAFSSEGNHLLAIRNIKGNQTLWQINVEDGHESQIVIGDGYNGFDQISIHDNHVLLIASGGRTPSRIIKVSNIESDAESHFPSVNVIRRATSEEIPQSDFSLPKSMEWQAEDTSIVHGIYYPAHNPDYEGIGLPPLIVRIHGGPTGQVRNVFNLGAQFYTSRGFSLLEVNYRGSSGYGREYRNSLRGNWGIFDVQDAVSGAEFLVKQGEVDKCKLVIAGGSAGGYTVLRALEERPGFFKAGICLFGVSNLFTLAAETHKFEAHYQDTLLGLLPAASEIYRERSPIYFAEKIFDPLAIFQGEEDVVVPRKQMDEIVEILRRRGVPHIYHVYPGEGHGFRKIETIEHYYRSVESFLREFVIYA